MINASTRFPSFRLSLGLVALLLAGGAMPLPAMIQEAAAPQAAAAWRPLLGGFASFAERSVLVLEVGTRAAAKAGEEAKGDVVVNSEVLNYQKVVGSDGKRGMKATRVHRIGPEWNRMVQGPDLGLILADTRGNLARMQLGWGSEGWEKLRVELILNQGQRKTLGLPDQASDSLAVGLDGAIVLAYGRKVAWLPPAAGACAKEQVKWLLDEAPAAGAQGETKADAAALAADQPPVLVAVDSQGIVFVVDGQSRSIVTINPATLDEDIVCRWPGPGFVPVSATCAGRNLLLAGREGKNGQAKMYLTYTWLEDRKPYQGTCRLLDRAVGPALAITAEKELVTGDPVTGEFRILPYNLPSSESKAQPTAESKAELMAAAQALQTMLATLDQQAAQKAEQRAEAVRAELFQEEADKEKKNRLREKKKRQKAARAVRAAAAADPVIDEGSATEEETEPEELPVLVPKPVHAAKQVTGPKEATGAKPAIRAKLATRAQPATRVAPVHEGSPSLGEGVSWAKRAASTQPAGGLKQIPDPRQAGEIKPADGAKQASNMKPTEGPKQASNSKPAGGATPAAPAAAAAPEARPFRLNPEAKPFDPNSEEDW